MIIYIEILASFATKDAMMRFSRCAVTLPAIILESWLFDIFIYAILHSFNIIITLTYLYFVYRELLTKHFARRYDAISLMLPRQMCQEGVEHA